MEENSQNNFTLPPKIAEKQVSSSPLIILGIFFILIIAIFGYIFWRQTDQEIRNNRSLAQNQPETTQSGMENIKESTASGEGAVVNVDQQTKDAVDNGLNDLDSTLNEYDSITSDLDSLDGTQDNSPAL